MSSRRQSTLKCPSIERNGVDAHGNVALSSVVAFAVKNDFGVFVNDRHIETRGTLHPSIHDHIDRFRTETRVVDSESV